MKKNKIKDTKVGENSMIRKHKKTEKNNMAENRLILQTRMVYKIRSLLMGELLHQGSNALSFYAGNLDYMKFINFRKQVALLRIVRQLINRFPQKENLINRAYDYVSWLLDVEYKWFE